MRGLLLLLTALAGCHLVLGHNPPTSDRPIVLEHGASELSPRPEAGARDLAFDLAIGEPARPADAARERSVDGAKDRGKETSQPCKVDGVCGAGESCAAGCADCCGCGEADCSQPNTTCVSSGGSLATDLGSWKVTPGVSLGSTSYPGTGKVRVQLCGLDLSGVGFTGSNPVNPADRGAYAAFGLAFGAPTMTQPPQAVWLVLTSATGPFETSWDGKPASHDLGYRKYLVQTWYRGAAPLGTLSQLGHQYNAEKGSIAGTKYHGADLLDLRLEVSKGPAGAYTYQAWSRLALSSATTDGCSWSWNTALNNTSASQAWVKLLKHGQIPKLDYETTDPLSWTAAKPYLWIYNGVSASNTGHTVKWARASIELSP